MAHHRLLPLLLLTGSLATAATLPATPEFPYPIQVDTLPNGVTVARVKYPSPGLIAYYTVVRAGSRNELEKGHTGYAHFFEHMMFKGTARHPVGEREKIIGRYGVDDNAYTSEDETVFQDFGPAAVLPDMVELEADRFASLAYTEPVFQTEAKAVLGEYHKDAASPDLKAFEKLLETAYTKHSYGHSALGYQADVEGMPKGYDYSRRFFQTWYRPDNVLVLVVGDFDDAALMTLVRKHYGPWKGKTEVLRAPVEPAQTKERRATLSWPTPTLTRLWMSFHVPAASLERSDTAVGTVLASYLAGPTSPLYQHLILEQQTLESLDADDSAHRDAYLFTLYANLKSPNSLVETESAIDHAVSELQSGKVDAARVEAIKSNLHYGALMKLQTANDVALALSGPAGLYGRADGFSRSLAAVTKVKPAELVAFARKYLTHTNRTVITLTPPAGPAHPEASKP